jgi:ribonuclease BN (tRNA processing enzyme)
MTVKALYAFQNGMLGFEKTGLFYGERSAERVQIPVTCYLVRASDATILFDTGLSPRAVPGLMRSDPLARFSDQDLLVHRLDSIGLEPADVDLVVLSHLHYDHAGGAHIFDKSTLVVQQDEYSYAHYPARFFAPFYYRKNFDLPPGVVWDPTRAMHSIKRLKTIARLTGGRIFPSHDPAFWATVVTAPDCYR